MSTTRSLNEVAAAGGDLWVVLWQALGDVWLWSDAPHDQSGELFGPSTPDARIRALRARREAPQLTESLGTFHLLRSAPQVLDALQVANACTRVARWAEEESLIEVAAYFGEGAAVVDPEDPARANEAARLCRLATLTRRSVAWYDRGFQLSVRAQNRKEVINALLGYGSLLHALGLHTRARPILR
ncbi:MAG: hypothetical protein AB1941_01080 [Gemmatimonadota bacterium]